jgi:hypothetical protein
MFCFYALCLQRGRKVSISQPRLVSLRYDGWYGSGDPSNTLTFGSINPDCFNMMSHKSFNSFSLETVCPRPIQCFAGGSFFPSSDGLGTHVTITWTLANGLRRKGVPSKRSFVQEAEPAAVGMLLGSGRDRASTPRYLLPRQGPPVALKRPASRPAPEGHSSLKRQRDAAVASCGSGRPARPARPRARDAGPAW